MIVLHFFLIKSRIIACEDWSKPMQLLQDPISKDIRTFTFKVALADKDHESLLKLFIAFC